MELMNMVRIHANMGRVQGAPKLSMNKKAQ
jgi:hypothetical protein